MRASLALVVASLALALAWSPEPTQVCQKAASQAQHYATCSCPYVWGGTSCGCGGNGGMDCSGLVYRSYNDAGWSGILRTAAQQYTQGQSCKPGCSASNPSACSVGDLFFYCFSQPCPDHVVMYIGNGQVAECPHTGENCHVITPYATSFQGCKSICNGQPSTTSTSGTTSGPSGSGSGSGPSGSGSGSGSSKPPSSGAGSSKPPSGSGSGSGSSKPPSSGTTTTASSGGSKTSASSATTKSSSLNAASAGHQSTNGHSASAAANTASANTASAGHANAASAGTNANTASGNAASGNNNAASGNNNAASAGSNANAASGNAASGNSGSSATGPSRGRLYR